MRTIRLYVALPLREHADLTLPEEPARHALKVLRLEPGHPVVLFNGDGHEYPARIESTSAGVVRLQLGARQQGRGEATVRITLAQAVARGDKMDLVVQKATELGAVRIVPLLTERGEVRLDARRIAKRQARWQAIATSACEQCGRSRVPDILAPLPLVTWLQQAGTQADPERWMLLPGAGQRIRDWTITTPAAITLVVGPEGGLGPHDVEQLSAAGYRPAALGPRILRTETAGLAALAAIQAVHGDL